MKLITITTALSLFLIGLAHGQTFEGIATYKTDRKVNLNMNGNSTDKDENKALSVSLQKQFQKEFTLSFSDEEAVYQEVEKLNRPAPKPAAGNIQITIETPKDIFYRNLKENSYINETELLNKPFLIKDVLEKPDWKLEKETKNIGAYKCFKATFSEAITDQEFNPDTKDFTEVEKTRITTAWYTLDIPLAHGPGKFWGLPGFILEVSQGDVTILCSKIVINPTRGVVIKIPSSGKEVSQEEFDKIQAKKEKEMMERFSGAKQIRRSR